MFSKEEKNNVHSYAPATDLIFSNLLKEVEVSKITLKEELIYFHNLLDNKKKDNINKFYRAFGDLNNSNAKESFYYYFIISFIDRVNFKMKKAFLDLLNPDDKTFKEYLVSEKFKKYIESQQLSKFQIETYILSLLDLFKYYDIPFKELNINWILHNYRNELNRFIGDVKIITMQKDLQDYTPILKVLNSFLHFIKRVSIIVEFKESLLNSQFSDLCKRIKNEFILSPEIITLSSIIYWNIIILNNTIKLRSHLNTLIEEKINESPYSELAEISIIGWIRGYIVIIGDFKYFLDSDLNESSNFDKGKLSRLLPFLMGDSKDIVDYSLQTIETFLDKIKEDKYKVSIKDFFYLLQYIIPPLDSSFKSASQIALNCLKKLFLQIDIDLNDIIKWFNSNCEFTLKKKIIGLNEALIKVEKVSPSLVESLINIVLEGIKERAFCRISSQFLFNIIIKVDNQDEALLFYVNKFIEMIECIPSSSYSLIFEAQLEYFGEKFQKILQYFLESINKKKEKNELLFELYFSILYYGRKAKLINFENDSIILLENKIHLSENDVLKIAIQTCNNSVVNILSFICGDFKRRKTITEIELLIVKHIIRYSIINSEDEFKDKILPWIFKLFRQLNQIIEIENQKKDFKEIKKEEKEEKEEKEKKKEKKEEGEKGIKMAVKIGEWINEIFRICDDNLKFDSTYEHFLPYFQILNEIIFHFPKIMNFSKDSQKWKRIGLFALAFLSSTYDIVRKTAFKFILSLNNPFLILNLDEWINFSKNAYMELSSPKYNVSEGASLKISYIFNELIESKDFTFPWEEIITMLNFESEIKLENIKGTKQIVFIENILRIWENKQKKVKDFLFEKSSSKYLYHGELSVLSNIMKFIFDNKELKQEYIILLKQIVEFSLETFYFSEKLLSSFGITDEETGNVIVDCRSRISKEKPKNIIEASNDIWIGDYENLLSTGIWLLSKNNALLLQEIFSLIPFNLSKELYFDFDRIKDLIFSLVKMVLNFKHRGVFLLISEAIEIMIGRAEKMQSGEIRKLTMDLLPSLLNEISIMGVNKTLRRSAGIPFALISFLRKSQNPQITQIIMKFILDQIQKSKSRDQNIIGLNISKYLFEDSIIKEKIGSFASEILLVSSNALNDKDFGIRNAGLMAFTSVSKYIFGSNRTDRQLLNKKCISLCNIFRNSPKVIKNFIEILSDEKNTSIFPVLLFISNLKYETNKNNKEESEQLAMLQSYSRSLLTSPNMHLRKIAAKAMISFIDPNNYISEAIIISQVLISIKEGDQNTINGLFELITALLAEEKIKNQKIDSEKISEFLNIFSKLNITNYIYITKALYLKILKKFIFFSEIGKFNEKIIENIRFELEKFINNDPGSHYFVTIAIKFCVTLKEKLPPLNESLDLLLLFKPIFHNLELLIFFIRKLSDHTKEENIHQYFKIIQEIINKVEDIKLISKKVVKFLAYSVDFAQKDEKLLPLYYELSAKLFNETNNLKSIKKEKMILLSKFAQIIIINENKAFSQFLTGKHMYLLFKNIIELLFEQAIEEEDPKYTVHASLAAINIIELIDISKLKILFNEKEIVVSLYKKFILGILLLLYSENREVRKLIASKISFLLFTNHNGEFNSLPINDNYARIHMLDRIKLNLVINQEKEDLFTDILIEILCKDYFQKYIMKNKSFGCKVIFSIEPSNEFFNPTILFEIVKNSFQSMTTTLNENQIECIRKRIQELVNKEEIQNIINKGDNFKELDLTKLERLSFSIIYNLSLCFEILKNSNQIQEGHLIIYQKIDKIQKLII